MGMVTIMKTKILSRENEFKNIILIVPYNISIRNKVLNSYMIMSCFWKLFIFSKWNHPYLKDINMLEASSYIVLCGPDHTLPWHMNPQNSFIFTIFSSFFLLPLIFFKHRITCIFKL